MKNTGMSIGIKKPSCLLGESNHETTPKIKIPAKKPISKAAVILAFLASSFL